MILPSSWRLARALSRPWWRFGHLRPATRFWLALLALNALLLAPALLLAGPQGDLWPRWGRDVRSWYDLLVRREHADLLRLHVEPWLLAGLGLLGLARRRGWSWLVASVLVLDWMYQVYAAVMVYLYHGQPNWFNDWAFLRSGLGFLLDSLPVPKVVYALVLLGVLLVWATIGYLSRVVSAEEIPAAVGRKSRAALAVLLAAALVQAAWFGPLALADPNAVVVSFTAQVAANLQAARQSRAAVASVLQVDPFAVYDYQAYPLARRPHIYFFFVESYGSVLYRRADWRAEYQALLTRWEERLAADGWSMASTLSESPVWGGGSWMAYISALFGLRVSEQQQFLALREKFQYLPYPSLGRYLHDQGYLYTWVTPLARRLSPSILEKNRRFYGMDVWITFDDLDYHGPLYGWGPSPPDQFVLGYIQDFAARQNQPVFTVYLTQSSHYPWTPLPPVVDDWRALATLHDPRSGKADLDAWKQVPHHQVRWDYWNAIAYTWDMLGDFLLNLDDPDAIVILLGDHQPPRVSAQRDTFATPLHILTRDPAWVTALAEYGFRPGLWLEQPEATVRHEAMYSLLVRELVRHYGADPTHLPPYLPQGLTSP